MKVVVNLESCPRRVLLHVIITIKLLFFEIKVIILPLFTETSIFAKEYCLPGTARFIPANKISPKFKRVHESFLSPKLFFCQSKKMFCVFSVFMEPEKASTRMKTKKTKKTKMLMSFKSTFYGKHKSLF